MKEPRIRSKKQTTIQPKYIPIAFNDSSKTMELIQKQDTIIKNVQQEK